MRRLLRALSSACSVALITSVTLVSASASFDPSPRSNRVREVRSAAPRSPPSRKLVDKSLEISARAGSAPVVGAGVVDGAGGSARNKLSTAVSIGLACDAA